MPSHNDVAHNWAHQTGRARRGYNMYYEGETIYSYGPHFAIARILSGGAVLFSNSPSSVSTAKHKTIARRAIPDGVPVFVVSDVLAVTDAEHRRNYWDILRGRVRLLDRARTARSRRLEYLEGARECANAAYSYSRFFRLGFRQVKDSPDVLRMLEEGRAAVRRREREAWREERLKIQDWLAGKTDRAPHTKTPYVRVEGETVRTSWGVSVPLCAAVALFRLARRCVSRGRGFHPAKSHAVGSYRLGGIDSDGVIHVGCHRIPFSVQSLAARALGL